MARFKRYQLKKGKCLFVEAKVYDDTDWRPTGTHKPDDINCAHVMDKSVTPAKILKLNKGAAFITRFIVLGVPIKYIPDILVSEYGANVVTNPAGEVETVLNMLDPDFLEERDYKRPYQAPQSLGGGTHSGKYDLDFKVNAFNVGILKGPL